LLSSAFFLAVSHSYRYANESTTERAFHKPILPDYAKSVANLHGWADGDPFMVNYVGHPMQGAVSNFIWQHNDRAYRTAEFGRNRRYWKARLRGMAFAWAYSEQFEIGVISEASIGNTQSFYPQVGFVDHVVTPTIGMGWAIAEDAIDRMVIQPIERRVSNPWVRMAVRAGMNPARSWANVMGGNVGWHRDDRPSVFKPFPEESLWEAETRRRMESAPVNPPPGVPPFEFSFHSTFRDYLGNGNAGACLGGGGTGAFRIGEEWQWVVDVGGCKMLGFGPNWSGDTLTYMTGPRYTPHTSGRWTPHAEFLIGGTKVTQSYENPYLRAQVADWKPTDDEERTAKHQYYTTEWDNAAFALRTGVGMQFKLNNALALQVADVSYQHAWTREINGFEYRNALAVSGGLVLRMGTW
jgi:hypothetical protein